MHPNEWIFWVKKWQNKKKCQRKCCDIFMVMTWALERIIELASLSIISEFFKWNMDRTICIIHIIRAINIRTVDDDNRWCTQILIAHNVQVYTCTHSIHVIRLGGKKFDIAVWSSSTQTDMKCDEKNKLFTQPNLGQKVHVLLFKPKIQLSP